MANATLLNGAASHIVELDDIHPATRNTEDIEKKFKIVENPFKIHASCRHTHHAIDLILDSDGQTIVRKTDYPEVDPGLPVTKELSEKFRSLTRGQEQ